MKEEKTEVVEITMNEKSSKAERVEILKKQIERELREQVAKAGEQQVQIKMAELQKYIEKIIEEEKTAVETETRVRVGIQVKLIM